jgi:hypothetical protein
MLLLEIIIIAAVLVFLFAQVDKLRKKRSAATAGQNVGNGDPNAQVQAASSLPVPLKLRIEGTKPFSLKNAGFFGQFGVPVKRLSDACQFEGPGNIDSFPAAVASAVRALYEEGSALGPEIMRLICHERELAPTEALYFALTRSGSPEKPEYTMYAFLDKVRA